MKSKTRIVIITLALCSIIFITASADGNYVFDAAYTDLVEYSYKGISDEKAGIIIFDMFGDDSYIIHNEIEVKMMINLLCIFGHSKQHATITQTYHNTYTTSPKCKVVYSDVEYCTRDGCDYYTVLDQYENRIGCH